MRNNTSLNPPKPKPPKPPRKKPEVLPPLKDGRPTKRTPENRAKILEALELGTSFDSAAKYAGMDPDTLRTWRREDTSFFEDCEKARGRMQVTMLAVIKRAAITEKQWQAAAWKLERIFPEEFGRKFQPLAMVQEQPQGDLPGKTYHVAIAPIEAEQQ